MSNKKAFFILLLIVGCSHSNQRSPSSIDVERPVIDYETHIKIPKSTDGNINYVLVRGRFEYKLDKKYTRDSRREFLPEENKDIRNRLYVNEQLSYWQATVAPSGFVVPRIQIQKAEGLKCFITHQASLLNGKTDPKKFNFSSSLQYGVAYALFDSDDKQSLIAPYDEINGLDAVVCTYLGEKDSIDINVKYSFLSPEAGRFSDKYKNDILEIYAPYTKKETFTLQGTKVKNVENDLPWNDEFNLADTRFEKVEDLYKKWKSERFVLTPEIKEAIGSTLGVYGKNQSFKMSSKDEIKKKELGKVSKGALVRVIPKNSINLKKGIHWYNAHLIEHTKVKGLKKFFMGKKSEYARSDVKPLSFYCTVDDEVVFKSETSNGFNFSSPKDGTLFCGVNMHKKTKKVRGIIDVDLLIYDPQDIKVILESFMNDEKNFVESYSQDISASRLESIKVWTNKLNE